MTHRPLDIGEFATNDTYSAPGELWDGQSNKVEPPGALRSTGFVPSTALSAENLNWFINKFAAWVKYLDGPLDWDAVTMPAAFTAMGYVPPTPAVAGLGNQQSQIYLGLVGGQSVVYSAATIHDDFNSQTITGFDWQACGGGIMGNGTYTVALVVGDQISSSDGAIAYIVNPIKAPGSTIRGSWTTKVVNAGVAGTLNNFLFVNDDILLLWDFAGSAGLYWTEDFTTFTRVVGELPERIANKPGTLDCISCAVSGPNTNFRTSTDGGKTWSAAGTITDFLATAIQYDETNDVYVVTGYPSAPQIGRIYTTADFGATFTQRYSAGANTRIDTLAINAGDWVWSELRDTLGTPYTVIKESRDLAVTGMSYGLDVDFVASVGGRILAPDASNLILHHTNQ